MALKERKFYIENLRILLSALVILHHWAISYGAPGGWYYVEENPSFIAFAFMTIFVATNQSFFMGMFFLISAYFLERSIRRKSVGVAIKDKLKRLGIPLFFFVFGLHLIILFLNRTFLYGQELNFIEFLKGGNWFGWGPMWFVEALLYFSLIAILIKAWLSPTNQTNSKLPLPKDGIIILTSFLLGIISFLVRLAYPVGKELEPFSFQLGHFSQYIFLFIIGIIASKNDWFEQISYKRAKNWLWMLSVIIFIGFPSIFYFGGAADENVELFMGGFTIQSFTYSIWEQIVGIGLIFSLLGIFRKKFNIQGKWAKKAAASSYTVYIIHPLFLILCSAMLLDSNLSSTAKFLLFAPVVVLITFFFGNIIRQLPLARKVL